MSNSEKIDRARRITAHLEDLDRLVEGSRLAQKHIFRIDSIEGKGRRDTRKLQKDIEEGIDAKVKFIKDWYGEI